MQTMASVSMSLQQPGDALNWMEQSMALWHVSSPDDADDEGGASEASAAASAAAAAHDVAYDFRINSAKILLELNQHNIAIEVLEQLLMEDAEVPFTLDP
jgi:hypothetical protein